MDVDDLKQKLSYNPDTGIFHWIDPPKKGPASIGAIAGSVTIAGYRTITIDGKPYAAHRLAFLWMTGSMPILYVDHKNGIRDDNRWENLREVTQSENLQNSRLKKTGKSGYRGVTTHHSGKWASKIKVNGKSIFLGLYENVEDAYRVRQEAEKKYWKSL